MKRYIIKLKKINMIKIENYFYNNLIIFHILLLLY